MKSIQNSKFKIQNSRKGFTLIELMVAMLIFSIIIVGIVAVFVSSIGAYQKSKAMKKVKADTEFAINSIAKDVRMGKIESTDPSCIGSGKKCIMVTRNRDQSKACYMVSSDNLSLGVAAGVSGNVCPANGYDNLVDLAATGMTFSSDSGFYSQQTDLAASPQIRGWVEMNFNINLSAGNEMETDQINIQTTASSRDYIRPN